MKIFLTLIGICVSVINVMAIEYSSQQLSKEEFNILYKQWMNSISIAWNEFQQTPSMSSRGPKIINTECLAIVAKGPINLPLLISIYRNHAQNQYLPIGFAAITKIHFEDIFNAQSKEIILTDYKFSYKSLLRV